LIKFIWVFVVLFWTPMFAGLDGNLKRLFVMNIVFAVCFYLVSPLFPLYLDALGVSESRIGLILSLGSFTGAVSTLLSGLLVDRFGKRSLLIRSVLFGSVAVGVISLVGHWLLIVPFWMMFHLSQSLFEPTRLAYISDRVSDDNRGRLFGLMNLAWPVAGIIGPVLSGRLAEGYGWSVVFSVAVGVCLFGLVPLLGLEDAGRSSGGEGSGFDRGYLGVLGLHFVFHVFLTTAIGIMNMAIPIYLADVFGLSYSTIGLFFTVSSVVTMVTQAPSGALSDRFGMKRTMLVFLGLVPFMYLVWVFSGNWVLLLVSYSLSMALWSMTWPASLVLVSEAVPASMRGTAISARMTGYRVGYTLGPMICGFLLQRVGGVSPFVAATVIFGAALPFGFRFSEVSGVKPVPDSVMHDD
jgi:MFS family permease